MNTYILIDSALIQGAGKIPPLTEDARPSWIVPLYEEKAYTVSPLLVDVEAARDSEAIEAMMALANACLPQLHSSIIDTEFALPELAEHLRKFIYIKTEAGEEFTLRFADSVVLPALAAHFSGGQWAAIAGPLARWRTHARDGSLKTLPPASPDLQPATTPITLTGEQIAAVKDALGADRLLARLRNMRPGESLGRSPMEAYQWASEARRMWLAAGRVDDVLLLTFARGVFTTKGRLLRVFTMPQILAQPDEEKVREGIRKAIEINTYPERP